jgi:hypothetical protein
VQRSRLRDGLRTHLANSILVGQDKQVRLINCYAKMSFFSMKITSDIKSPWLIHAKGALFIALGILSAALLIAQLPTIRTVVLLAVTIWAFCRFYYYLFYVLEKYLGREKRFAGIIDAIRFLLRNSPREKP